MKFIPTGANRPRRAARTALLGVLALAGSLLAVTSASALPTSFGSNGARAGQISEEPAGIAIEEESGDVYVSDRANSRIEKFGPEGEFILAWGWGVADGESEELQLCTSTCFKGLEGSGAGEFKGNEGIAVDNDPLSLSHGDVYVLDSGNDRIQKFSPTGGFLTMFGGEVNASTKGNICPASEAASCKEGISGVGPGEFEEVIERALSTDPTTGTVYVGDRNRVQRFSEEGAPESEVAFTTPEVGLIRTLAVDSVKDIYLRGGLQEDGIHKYDPTGKELGKPRDPGGSPEGLAIAIGPGDELFLNDFTGIHHILAFNAEGEQTASFDRGELEQNGQRGIAYSSFTKALYILNAGAVRIVTPPPPGPFVLPESQSASELQPTTATLNATINPEGAPAEYHFEYGTTTAYGQSTPTLPLDAVNEVQSVTVVATGGGFTLAFKGESSAEIPFNATAGEVQAALEAIPALGAGQIAVTGEAGGPWSVEFTGSLGGQDVPELSAGASGLTSEPGSEPSAAVATTTQGITLFEDRAVSAAIASLQPSTTYHFRAVATNGSQTSFGPDQTFTTLPPVSIEHVSASQINATSARLEAELNPHGVQSEYRFEYGLTSAYGTRVPVPDGDVGAGSTATTVSNLIQELTPSSTYHFRVIAHNSLGEVIGEDHTFTTQGPASILADGRSWELVSPPNKHGSPLEPITEEGGLIQAAAGGGGLAYVALGPVNEEPKGVRSPHDTQLLAARGATGWSTQDITTPHEEVAKILVGEPSEYKQFAEDLGLAAVEPAGATPLSPQTTERTPYRREADGEFVPLVTAGNVSPGTPFGGKESSSGSTVWERGSGVEFRVASPDLSHVVLAAPQVLAPGFKAGFEAQRENLYELAGGILTLISILPNEEPTSEAGQTARVGDENVSTRGVVSDNGSQIVFETTGESASEHHLYQRDVVLKKTLQLDARQPGAAGGVGGQGPRFQAASSDGAKVFFTDDSQLTADSTAKPGQPDLYICKVGESAGQPTCALSDLSVDPNAGEAAGVAGEVSAIDATGRHVYFAANGVLTSAPNAHGETAMPGSCENNAEASCNLYEYDTDAHQIKLVAVLSGSEAQDWASGGPHHNFGSLTARTSPDGRYFTFMSDRSLTGYDNRDARSGQADEEVYQFDAESGELHCVSCDPTGARPNGVFDKPSFPGLLVDHPSTWFGQWLAGTVPGWTLQKKDSALYQSRYLSDSGREFFNSADALVPQDTNGVMDVYEFEPPGIGDCATSSKTYSSTSAGCVSLVSSGSSKEESAFLDASQTGDEVFFLTASRLSGADVDAAFDIYDAHVCTSSSPCPPPPPPPVPPCEGDACQNPSPAPGEQTPSSLTYKGPENPPAPAPAPAPKVKAKAKPSRAQLLSRALKACKKKKPRAKRLSCQRQARKRYGAKKSSAGKHGAGARGKQAGHAQRQRSGR